MAEFTPVDGEHCVMVPAGNATHPNLVGVRGLMKAIGDDGSVKVLFDGQSEELVVSANDLVEYDASAAPAADTPAPAAPAPAAGGGGGAPRVGIFFGTETGNTETAAEQIRDQLVGCEISAFKDIGDCDVSEMLGHDVILLGVSTWNIGDIQFNWEEKLDAIGAQDYSGMKVGIFGLGDAAGYPDTFVDGMGILWDVMKEKGPTLIGVWPTEGYEFDESRGLYDDNNFLGVVLDEDGEAELSPERIEGWTKQLLKELGVSA